MIVKNNPKYFLEEQDFINIKIYALKTGYKSLYEFRKTLPYCDSYVDYIFHGRNACPPELITILKNLGIDLPITGEVLENEELLLSR